MVYKNQVMVIIIGIDIIIIMMAIVEINSSLHSFIINLQNTKKKSKLCEISKNPKNEISKNSIFFVWMIFYK